jgi:glycosyltransferase involved in cell wall biosynthesis
LFGPFRRRGRPARISVVVPLYNHAAFIEQAIGSILEQGSIVQEIIVIDDGSSDHSASVMERLARSDRRIRFERQVNQGAHATINNALARCTGEFASILNSDDAYEPGRLSALADALDRDAAADVSASGLRFMDADGQPVANEWYEQARAFHLAGAELAVALLNGNFVMTTSNLMFRLGVLNPVGRFAALRYVHDLDWLLRALALGRRIALVDRPLLSYRKHGRNTIDEDHRAVRAEWATAAAAYLTLLWDRPGAPGIDWHHAAAAAAVLHTHELDRAAALCMAYLRRDGAAPLDRSALLGDHGFRELVKASV